MSDLTKRLRHPNLQQTDARYHNEVVNKGADEIDRTKFIEDAAVILVAKLQEIGDPTLADEVHDLHEALWGRPPTEANKISSVCEGDKS